MKKATFLRNIDGWNGEARLYRVDPPVLDSDDKPADHVIVSAVVAMFSGPETYIFPASPDGECLDYLELAGSFRGALDHEEALRGAGYEVEAVR